MIIAKSQEKPSNKKNDDDQEGLLKSSGIIIVDATCAPSNIKYLQDEELLNEA